MSKFNVGDCVKITLNVNNCPFGCNEDMVNLIGSKATVIRVVSHKDLPSDCYKSNLDRYMLDADFAEYRWDENSLKLCES